MARNTDAQRGNTARLAERFLNGRRDRKLTRKMLTWLQDVAQHEHNAHEGDPLDGTIFYEQPGLHIKDERGRDFATVTTWPNGAGYLQKR